MHPCQKDKKRRRSDIPNGAKLFGSGVEILVCLRDFEQGPEAVVCDWRIEDVTHRQRGE